MDGQASFAEMTRAIREEEIGGRATIETPVGGG
jgi:hypothetical protein